MTAPHCHGHDGSIDRSHSHRLERLPLAYRRVFGRQLPHTVKGEKNCVCKGCSHQSVPSLSNVAIRAAGGTNSVPPCFVTRSTKSRMADFAAPLFHDGSDCPPTIAMLQPEAWLQIFPE